MDDTAAIGFHSRDELSLLRLSGTQSSLEVSPQGAHLTGWTIHGAPPVLFLSPGSAFQRGRAIRGGVPLVFPWFGPRAGAAQHGFARVRGRVFEASSVGPHGARPGGVDPG